MSEERKKDVVRSWLEWLREKELGQCVLTMRNNPEKFITIVKQKRKMIDLLDAEMGFIIAWLQREERQDELERCNQKTKSYVEEIKKDPELWEIAEVQNFIHEIEKMNENGDMEKLIRLVLSSQFSEVWKAIDF